MSLHEECAPAAHADQTVEPEHLVYEDGGPSHPHQGADQLQDNSPSHLAQAEEACGQPEELAADGAIAQQSARIRSWDRADSTAAPPPFRGSTLSGLEMAFLKYLNRHPEDGSPSDQAQAEQARGQPEEPPQYEAATQQSAWSRSRGRASAATAPGSGDFTLAFVEYLDRHLTAVYGIKDSQLQHSYTVGGPRIEEADLSTLPAGSSSRPTAPTSSELTMAFVEYLDRHMTPVQDFEEFQLQEGSSGSEEADLSTLPAFDEHKPYPPPLPQQEQYVVGFAGPEDPLHPFNWPFRTKFTISCILMLVAFATAFASAVFSPAASKLEAEFHIGSQVATLATSLFVLGYASGPIIFGPMSELYGRRSPIILTAFGFGIFNIAVAVAKDIQTVMICRFFAGFFGSGPLTIVAAVFSDMFSNESRGVSISLFAAAIVCGPFTAPMIAGFIVKSSLGWRWTAYIPAFMGFAAAALAIVFQKESYTPVILVSKAAELRRKTKNWGIHAKLEEVEIDYNELVHKNISRPIRLLFTEPIVLLISLYTSFMYGLLYLSLTAYAVVFEEAYGLSQGVAGLPYLALIIGIFTAFGIVLVTNKSYVRKLKANNNIPVPEWRLPVVMIGGIVFPCGLFWFGWGGYRSSVSYWCPTIAGVFMGFSIFIVSLPCLNYIIDAYLMYAASAIAAVTVMRSIFGAVFPLFASYMVKAIGIQWSMTLLGCVSMLFIPMPFVFYRYGKKIRKLSKFAPALDIEEDERRRDEESRGGGQGDGSPRATPSLDGSIGGELTAVEEKKIG
ncbi:putative transporter [Teratosphaeria destructans]|uniref:Cercosporin MFS transporter CTB4 n=1 Tax=Teratosphaeria destructans TaxID=418781 RepID=A0A9W7W6P9_9PEZI|nr:putative transporter [Teratosphaeria destructans]